MKSICPPPLARFYPHAFLTRPGALPYAIPMTNSRFQMTLTKVRNTDIAVVVAVLSVIAGAVRIMS